MRAFSVFVASCVLFVLILFLAWCILFVFCWPLALLALILLPIVCLLALPLLLIGFTVEAAFALIRAVLFLPVRLVRRRRYPCRRGGTRWS